MTEIRHQLPGRIRLRVPTLITNSAQQGWLKQALLGLPGIFNVRINATAAALILHYDTDVHQPETLVERLQLLDWPEIADPQCGDEQQLTRSDPGLSLFACLATALLPPTVTPLMSWPLIAPMIIEGLEDASEGKLSSAVLDAIALGLSAGRNDHRTALLTHGLLQLGEYLEQATSRHSDQLLADLLRPPQGFVWIRRDGAEYQCLAEALLPGDVMLLGPGDPIAADGTVLSGVAQINQAALTGESLPVRREAGSYLQAGGVIHDGQLQVKVDKSAGQSTTARLAAMIHQGLSEKSQTQQATANMAQRRVKITMGVGALVFGLTRDLHRVASVFLVDYACALKLSTPVTFKSAMYRAAQAGIVLKGGRAIENIAQADTLVFDKTGTLTYGDMAVTDVVPLCDSNSAKDLLAIAASLEEHSNHPLANAIVAAAHQHALPHIDHGEVEYVVAHGLKATMINKDTRQDSLWVIGSRHFLEQHHGVNFTAYQPAIEALKQQGRHLLFIAEEGKLLGMLGLVDQLRPEAQSVVTQLKQRGIKQLVMISGDSQAKAQQLAADLGIDRCFAEAEPADKMTIIQTLQDEGANVLFVGDGVNDAPAMTTANVGIAMAKGTELARQAADGILLKDSLEELVTLHQLAQDAMACVNSNIRIAEWVNTGIMLAAASGKLSPGHSALLHNGTTLAVLLRSLSLRHG
ncbi:heavy metal translocating P-type ATPase [Ferrimonas pelagia]|uniref:P-type Zn(2+) transporter n=1 Tax=Ferrimonas pelagia TaxID=1177826 RepID=A0ABP9F498_9GAMM